jgi:hypothetical protein
VSVEETEARLPGKKSRVKVRGGAGRDRLARSEHEIRKARETREQQTRDEDRAQRAKLELASGKGARVGFVDMLNGLSHSEHGFSSIQAVRDVQKLGYKTGADHNRAYARLEKHAQAQAAAFNRLHPRANQRVDGSNPSGLTNKIKGLYQNRRKRKSPGVTDWVTTAAKSLPGIFHIRRQLPPLYEER